MVALTIVSKPAWPVHGDASCRCALVHVSSDRSVRGTLLDVIKAAPSRYILKKRTAYLMAFAQYVKQKADKQPIQKPTIDAKCLSTTLL